MKGNKRRKKASLEATKPPLDISANKKELKYTIDMFIPLSELINHTENILPELLFLPRKEFNQKSIEIEQSSIFFTFQTLLSKLSDFLTKNDKENILRIENEQLLNNKNIRKDLDLSNNVIYKISNAVGNRAALEILKNCWILEKSSNFSGFDLKSGSPKMLTYHFNNIQKIPRRFFRLLDRNIKIPFGFNLPTYIKELVNKSENANLEALKLKLEKFNYKSAMKSFFALEYTKSKQMKDYISAPGQSPEISSNNISLKHFYINPHRVYKFAMLIVRKTMKDIFDPYNLQVFSKDLEKIICGMDKIRLNSNDMDFYKISKLRLFSHKISDLPSFKRRVKLFSEVRIILITNIIISLINSNFHFTEHQEGIYMKPMYILRNTWLMYMNLCRKVYENNLTHFKINPCEKVGQDLFQGRSMIVPKDKGFRAICDMKTGMFGKESTNEILRTTHMIIRNEIVKDGYMLMNGICRYPRIFEELSKIDFSNKYILKIDAIKCYDNIDRNIVKESIKRILNKEVYEVKLQKRIPELRINKVRDYSIDKLLKRECLKEINGVCQIKNITINFLPEKIITVTREELIKHIEVLCDNTIIRHNDTILKSDRGIPQGSILSNILGGLYFAYLDCRSFNRIFQNSKILRYVDDMLIITSDLSEIHALVEQKDLLGDKGFLFNTTNIESNAIEILENNSENKEIKLKNKRHKTIGDKKILGKNSQIDQDKKVKWCGTLISCKGIEIYFSIKTRNFYSFERAGLNLEIFLDNFLNTRARKVFFSPTNSYRYKNFYDVFNLYYKILKERFKRMAFINPKLLYKCVQMPIDLLKEHGLIHCMELVKKIQKSALENNNIGELWVL